MDSASLYHLFNRGNNKQKIFLEPRNYLFFLKKVRIHMSPYVDILSYCLMPNHFHFLISSDDAFDATAFSNSYRHMLSSYTRAINKQEGRSGSLFQQNSKFQKIETEDQAFICFNYIHQNPLKAKLVERLDEWEFSSYPDFIGLRKGTLCNQDIATKFLDLPNSAVEFEEMSYQVISDSWFVDE